MGGRERNPNPACQAFVILLVLLIQLSVLGVGDSSRTNKSIGQCPFGIAGIFSKRIYPPVHLALGDHCRIIIGATESIKQIDVYRNIQIIRAICLSAIGTDTRAEILAAVMELCDRYRFRHFQRNVMDRTSVLLPLISGQGGEHRYGHALPASLCAVDHRVHLIFRSNSAVGIGIVGRGGIFLDNAGIGFIIAFGRNATGIDCGNPLKIRIPAVFSVDVPGNSVRFVTQETPA